MVCVCVRVWGVCVYECVGSWACVFGVPPHSRTGDIITDSRPTSKVTSRSWLRSVLLPTSITTTSPGWNSSSRSFSHCRALQKEA